MPTGRKKRPAVRATTKVPAIVRTRTIMPKTRPDKVTPRPAAPAAAAKKTGTTRKRKTEEAAVEDKQEDGEIENQGVIAVLDGATPDKPSGQHTRLRELT